MVTSEEIEEQIVELHKEGKTSKEISKVVHKNFTFIGAVLRKRFPEEYPDTENNEEDKETEALKLFSKKDSYASSNKVRMGLRANREGILRFLEVGRIVRAISNLL